MAIHRQEVISVELHLYGNLGLRTQCTGLGNRLAVDEVDDTDYVSDLYIIIIVHIRLGKTEVGDHVILVPQDVAYGSGHVLYVYQHVEVRIAIAGVNPRIVLNRPAGE